MVRFAFVVLLTGLLAGCGTSSGPLSAGVGGEVVGSPPVEQFRGPPVVQLTFLTGIEPSIESTFLVDYAAAEVERPTGADDADALVPPDYEVVRTNMNAMVAKNVFYAVHLAKYLKLRAGDDFKLILNPVKLNYDQAGGYFYDPLEKDLPPTDIELSFLSYVHPETAPSTRGEVLTTYGETLAPIVSLRMDPVFNPQHGGAIALTDILNDTAVDPDGHGLRAQLVDYLNVKQYGHAGRNLGAGARDSGPFEPGTVFELEMNTFTLLEEPPEDDLLSQAVRERAKYDPGVYYAYEFYEGYYRIIMSALRHIDNRAAATLAQKEYWAFYDSPQHLEEVMLLRSDRRKYGLLLKYRAAELAYLEDRDDRWMDQVLETADFGDSFKALRDAEQEARNDYINAQIEAGIGVALAVLGAVAAGYSATQGDDLGTVGGSMAAGIGVAMVNNAVAEMEQVDAVFISSFQTAYQSQKIYVIESAEGDRISVRAGSWDEFREALKTRYDERFRQQPQPAPTTGTGNAVPTT